MALQLALQFRTGLLHTAQSGELLDNIDKSPHSLLCKLQIESALLGATFWLNISQDITSSPLGFLFHEVASAPWYRD